MTADNASDNTSERPTEADARRMITAWLNGPGDAYTRMNALRDGFNAAFGPAFELYLEDIWNDHAPGQTWFEYIVRSRRTLEETSPLAYDIYLNHQDAGGVWHLGDYQHTRIVITDAEPLLAFMREHLLSVEGFYQA